MLKLITLKRLILAIAIVVVLSFTAYWLQWRRGRIIASASGTYHTRYFIREIPTRTDMLSLILALNDSPLYRCEVWRFSHCMTDCRTSNSDSYRAKTARIEVTSERCIFYLDDRPWATFNAYGEWKNP